MEEKKVLDSIVTVTEWIIKQTVDLTKKKIITIFFLNLILLILVYKKLQSHFMEKGYLGNIHIHGWGTFLL